MSHHDPSDRHSSPAQPHAHHHSGGESGTLSEEEKLRKMIAHWIDHNLDHARSFDEWAERAERLGKAEVAVLLRQARQDMERMSKNFQHALTHLADA